MKQGSGGALSPQSSLTQAEVLHTAARLQEAVEAYAAYLKINETSAEGWYGAGCAHLALKAFGAAASCLSRAKKLAPRSGAIHYNLAKSQFELGRVESAVAHFEKSARLDAGLARMARESIACIVPGNAQADHAAVLRARRTYADSEARDAPRSAARPAHSAFPRKLRLGYLSAFFGERNWMKPVFALINRHDRAAFEIHMLSDGEPPSAASGYRDHDADYVHDLRGVDNARAAGIIEGLGLDVLIDLNGYSFQSRLPLLMRRPAPHVVGWFNMFATTGVPAFDWLVGDAAVIRHAEERHYIERIHRVPGTYLAFEVLYKVPDVAPPPCASPGAPITFGCLGSHYKLTDGVLSAWARILHDAPRAKLLVKNGALDDTSTRDDLLARLHALGVDPARVTLDGRGEHFAFLDAYRYLDIALDTFPYNGGTTTTEALWQGVPVLTFDGDRWASRTSKSLLLAADLPDWVMPNGAAYVRRAAALANDPATPAMLAALRASMRARLAGSAACDADGLCRAMEAFYRGLA